MFNLRITSFTRNVIIFICKSCCVFIGVVDRAQSRGRSDDPIRTQRDIPRAREKVAKHRSSKRRYEKESDSSNNFPPVIVGPLTTNPDLARINGEHVYNLPLMIQQPFLHEKKEPIKVDISVKLIPRPKKRDKKRKSSNAQVEEIIIVDVDDCKGVKNSVCMEIINDEVVVLKEEAESISDHSKDIEKIEKENVENEPNAIIEENVGHIDEVLEKETVDICQPEDTMEDITETKENEVNKEPESEDVASIDIAPEEVAADKDEIEIEKDESQNDDKNESQASLNDSVQDNIDEN